MEKFEVSSQGDSSPSAENAWSELVDYDPDAPSTDATEEQTSDGKVDTNVDINVPDSNVETSSPESETNRINQEIFNGFMETIPEDEATDEFIYSEEGYSKFFDYVANMDSDKYSDRQMLSAIFQFSEQYMDAGGKIPHEDGFFVDEALYEGDDALFNNLTPKESAILDRIVEQRVESFKDEAEQRIRSALVEMAGPVTISDKNSLPPQYKISETIRDLDSYKQHSKDPHYYDAIETLIHDECLPTLLQSRNVDYENKYNMDTLITMINFLPQCLEGEESQIIDVADFIKNKTDRNDYSARSFLADRLTQYAYDNPDNKTIVDKDGNLTDAFQDMLFHDLKILGHYALNGTYEDGGYQQSMIDQAEKYLSKSQAEALKTMAAIGLGESWRSDGAKKVLEAYDSCETDEDMDRVTRSLDALGKAKIDWKPLNHPYPYSNEGEEYNIPTKIIADMVNRHPEIDFSNADIESQVKISEAISVVEDIIEKGDKADGRDLSKSKLFRDIDINDYDVSSRFRQKVVDYIANQKEADEKTVNEVVEFGQTFSDISRQFSTSNSLELRRISDSLADELVDSCITHTEDGVAVLNFDGLTERAERVENIFLHNNLPLLAKKFLVFRTLHPPEKFDKDFKARNGSTLSPTLMEAEGQGLSDKYGIILRDLVKSAVESNDLELRKYLESQRDGQAVIDRINSGEASFDELSDDEQKLARTFVLHTVTAYNENQPDPKMQIVVPDTITQDLIQTINQRMGVTGLHNASDRMVRTFAGLAGYHGVNEMLAAMDSVRDAADERNRKAPPRFVLKSGDLVKNASGQYLDDILEHGSNCKEFLGSDADSDGTPLDTDLTLVSAEADIKDCAEIQTNPNGNYGYVWFVVRNTPDRFRTTRKSTPDQAGGDIEPVVPIDGRLELFSTGVLGKSHYGIRTGFGSTHIDAIVIEQPIKDAAGNMSQGDYLDRTAFRIVKNGFYIPVYDRKSGELIFTPDDYDRMRAKFSGNHEYLMGEYRVASDEDFEADAKHTAEIEVNIEENEREVASKDAAIQAVFAKALEGTGLKLRDHIDDDLTPGYIEITSTGSTGRGTNVPKDGDFDYILRVDRDIQADAAKMADISGRIRSAIIFGEKSTIRDGKNPGDFRTEHVHVDGCESELDVDVTFVTRTDKLTYATEDAIRDYLSNLDEAHRAQAVRNIIYAKHIFKDAECYKPRHAGGTDETTGKKKAQGGLGGVGVENWILQNGGSLTAAARSFLEAAGVTADNPDAVPVSLEQFQQNYPIWDLGANHMAEGEGKYPHDNFTQNNLNSEGYAKIITVLKQYLGYA